MSIKMSIALVAALCAGCGAPSLNVALARYSSPAPAQTQRDAANADPTLEQLLIDQTCYEYSECRMSAPGLEV